MNLKNKSLIFSTFFIITIQIFLYLNNSQKSSFRYFIWNIQEVRIGKLICISFASGLMMSAILSNLIIPGIKNLSTEPKKNIEAEKEYSDDYVDNLNDSKENDKSYEMPPERDLRDVQPTISVNYRVIKKNDNNRSKDINETANNDRYEEDWNDDDSDW